MPWRPRGDVVQLFSSLTSALDEVGDQGHAPAALLPGKEPSSHYTAWRTGPRAGLDGWEKSRTHRDSIPGPSSP